MKYLYTSLVLLLLAGSLFPWHFQVGPDPLTALLHVLTGWHEALAVTNRRDIVLNLAIYAPIGFTGFLWRGWRDRMGAWGGTLLSGALLSLCIETLQHYVPGRQPSLVDVVCNTISTGLGLVLAATFEAVLASRRIEWRHRYFIHLSSALLLLCMWAASLVWPAHGPPLHLLERIRTLLHPGPWARMESMEGVLSWLLAGRLLTTVLGTKDARWWVWILLVTLCPMMVIVPGHRFTWSYLAGGVAAAVLLGMMAERRFPGGAWLAAAWLAWLVLDGLRPYRMLPVAQPFNWIPFADMLNAPWMLGVGTLLRKAWIYGAAFWLSGQTKLSRGASALVVLAVVLSVEVAQCRLAGRVGGLTDVSIALLMCLLLWQTDRHFAHDGGADGSGA